MKYLSIDIETTGLDRENHQILEIGIIAEDAKKPLTFDEIPKYNAIVLHEVDIVGSPYALTMPRNQEILKIIANIPKYGMERIDYMREHNIVHWDLLGKSIANWYHGNVVKDRLEPYKINIAGKNFRDFDYEYIKKIPEIFNYFKFNRRYIELGSIYTNFIDDEEVPNQETCLHRAGYVHETVTHKAIEDAWQVVLALRETY